MLEQILERMAIALEKIANATEERAVISKTLTADLENHTQAVNTLANQLPNQNQAAQNAQNTQNTQAPQNMQQSIPQNQPIQQPTPQSQQMAQNQISAAPIKEYSMQELAIAGRDLYTKNPQRLTAILQSFGIEALTLLPKERYGEMANLLIMEGVLK